jgi:hypothetical protein
MARQKKKRFKMLRPPKLWPHTGRPKLPRYETPTSVEDALEKINSLALGLDLTFDEYACRQGNYFCWLKFTLRGTETFMETIKGVKRHKYGTIRNFMRHAENCQQAGYVLEYHPSDPDDGFSILESLEQNPQGNLEDTGIIDFEEEKTPGIDYMLRGKEQNPDKEPKPEVEWPWDAGNAAFHVFSAFIHHTYLANHEDKKRVAVKSMQQITEYIVAEENRRAAVDQRDRELKAEWRAINSKAQWEQMKEESFRASEFEKILREAEQIRLDILEYDNDGEEPWEEED